MPIYLSFRCLRSCACLPTSVRSQSTCKEKLYTRDVSSDTNTLLQAMSIKRWRIVFISAERVFFWEQEVCSTSPRVDNNSQAGLQFQKPFCSQWENVLDTYSSSFVLYVAICASCRVAGSVCARRGSIGTIGIAGPGGSWSGSSGAIWAW